MFDAAITIAWCLDEDLARRTRNVREALTARHAFVPAIWPLEVTNALLVSERRERIDAAGVDRFLDALGQLPIQVDRDGPASGFAVVLDRARTHVLSAYDAAYLELALRLGAPLATLDEALSSAAERAGVGTLAS